jgi:predicted  nucleic acid-binding Zn-ribbon protein
MPTAPAEDQRRLLAVQELDTRADQARHRRASHPTLVAIAEIEQRAQALENEAITRSTEVGDIRREVTKAEDDVQSVRARAERDTARMDSGQGTPKDLQALQSELTTLAKRQSDLEDIELEAMERLDAAETALAAVHAKIGDERAVLGELMIERNALWAEIDAELDTIAGERAEAVAGIDTALVALYEKLRASHGGIGAAPLHHGECGGCHVKVDPGSLGEIASSAADTILRCDDCGRILVREG